MTRAGDAGTTMLGRTISHYRIVSQLGAGGMGVVYGAEDVRLGRPVALKFLPEELARDLQAVERLRLEARTASGLNHPHICTIYDVGEDEGRPFIVMELLKGQTLRQKLDAGPMKVSQVVDLGVQVADAMHAAHEHGIVHRDIKPANLFLTDRGPVKVMDFGLAKLTPAKDGSTTTGATAPADQLTAPGITLGTVSYMSPEQVAGDEIDGRTDLFSLGVVLYECATGHRPFSGSNSAVILAAILNRAPVAPAIYSPDLPLRLQEVINNCLEKDRDLRYQTAADLRADLKRVKRDLESGRSGTVSAGYDPRGSGSVSDRDPTGAGAARGVVVTPVPPTGSAQALPSASSAAAAGSPRSTAVRRVVIGTVISLLVVAATVSYVVWLREPVPPEAPTTTAARDSASGVAGPTNDVGSDPRLERLISLANSSLQSRDYRAAQGYADQVLAKLPDHAEARAVRIEAEAQLRRFDQALADARRRLQAGDVREAARAIDTARAIDAVGPGVAEISAVISERLALQAEAARQQLQRSRQAVGPQTTSPAERPEAPAATGARREPTSGAPVAPVPTTQSNPPAATQPRPGGPPAPLPVPKPEPDPVQPAAPTSAATPPSSALPEPVSPAKPSSAPASAPVAEQRDRETPDAQRGEDDDAAIRRVVATYARAIESKDLELFRSVKPNLSRDEEHRIESGFRAVSSQQVAISILSIDRRGSHASVRLKRRDAIEVGGRRQTTEVEQRLTLARTNAGWVIVEIGR